MKLLYVLCFVVPASMGFFAHVKDHFKKKLKKPECHVEWEDVTTPHCETHQEWVCVEEYKNKCKTEYSTSCQTEYNTQCKTEYEELCETTDHEKCHTEHDQECHPEYAEECWDEPECWLEEKEECHNVQVEVQHHDHQPKQQYKKWRRSVDDEVSEVSDVGGEVSEVEDLVDIDTSEEDV